MNLFSFSDQPIDPGPLRAALMDAAAGGYAAFEGWVRDHSAGHRVTRLEYEAFTALAVKEGERIVAEAIERFGVHKAACVHRVGSLDIGEMAVWVGVSSGHRAEAFAACRYIIDEVKHRVPIWKKEHYGDGDSGWVNCERCAEHAHDHADARQLAAAVPDFSRQMALREVGAEGQAKLAAARVLVIGAGGLGVPVLGYLAGAGVGTIGIADGDTLEASNLHRQTIYSLADVGRLKAHLAADHLRNLNPATRVFVHAERVDVHNVADLLSGYDLLVECSDNFATKFLVNDAAVLAGKPAVFASVYQYEGQLQVYRPDADAACLRCLWPEATRDGLVGNCAQAGVLGPVPGTLGSLQALEALKLLLGLPRPATEELLLIDLLTHSLRKVRTPRCQECRDGVCSRISGLVAIEPAADLELDVVAMSQLPAADYQLVDIRDADEVSARPIVERRARHIPMAQLLEDAASLDPGRHYVLVCSRGLRSRALAERLRGQGYARVYSLRGGVDSLTPAIARQITASAENR